VRVVPHDLPPRRPELECHGSQKRGVEDEVRPDQRVDAERGGELRPQKNHQDRAEEGSQACVLSNSDGVRPRIQVPCDRCPSDRGAELSFQHVTRLPRIMAGKRAPAAPPDGQVLRAAVSVVADTFRSPDGLTWCKHPSAGHRRPRVRPPAPRSHRLVVICAQAREALETGRSGA